MATVAQLGTRAMRKLGLGFIPAASQPAAGPTLSLTDVVGRVVRNLGIMVPEASRPAPLGTVTDVEVARRVLRDLGANLVAGVADPITTIAQEEVAVRALRFVGVNPADLYNVGSTVTWTYQQLAIQALLRLEIMAPDEPAEPGNQTYAEQTALAAHDTLVSLDLVTWGASAIPNAVFEAYVAMIANLMAPAFGKGGSADIGMAAQEMIRTQAMTGSIGQARAVLRVQTVHDDLVAEGMADWVLNAIPDAVGDAYVMLTAAALAPGYGKQMPADAVAGAMQTIRRVVLSGARGQGLALAKVWAAHDELVQAGVVSWPVTAIPVGFAEDYVPVAVSMLAPVYLQKPADDAFGKAVTRIRSALMAKDAEERATMKVRAVHDEMAAAGMVGWDINAIPSAVGEAYVGAVTVFMGEEAGKPVTRDDMQAAYQRVFDVVSSGPFGQAVAEEKVRAVHYQMEAIGRVRWTLANIPVGAEEPYVYMAASLLAADVRRKADPSWWQMGEMQLARLVSMPSTYEPVRAAYI